MGVCGSCGMMINGVPKLTCSAFLRDLLPGPVRVERVCEVKYDHLQGDRFRHAAVFLRWRLDKAPSDCRYDQLEVTAPFELAEVFSAGRSTR